MHQRPINGIQLAYVDRGNGPAVALLHGFPLDHTMWSGQIEALDGRYRVLAPDLRGFGRSSLAAPITTMRRMADDLAALLDALGIAEATICGLSMGGYVALEFARVYPERTRALVLCDTRAAADSPAAAAARLETAQRLLEEGPQFLVDAMMGKLFSPATLREQPERVEELRRSMAANDPRGLAAAARGMAERSDATGWLPAIACPALVLVGRDDVISPPEEMRGIAQAIPGARLVEIAAAGHLAPWEQPEAANAELRAFLGGVRS